LLLNIAKLQTYTIYLCDHNLFRGVKSEKKRKEKGKQKFRRPTRTRIQLYDINHVRETGHTTNLFSRGQTNSNSNYNIIGLIPASN
jgi:hypothetical protein